MGKILQESPCIQVLSKVRFLLALLPAFGHICRSVRLFGIAALSHANIHSRMAKIKHFVPRSAYFLEEGERAAAYIINGRACFAKYLCVTMSRFIKSTEFPILGKLPIHPLRQLGAF